MTNMIYEPYKLTSYLELLPIDVFDEIRRRVDRAARKSMEQATEELKARSERRLVAEINKQKLSFTALGLSREEQVAFLQKYGRGVSCLDVAEVDLATVSEWVEQCPNVTHFAMKKCWLKNSKAQIHAVNLRVCPYHILCRDDAQTVATLLVDKLPHLISLDLSHNVMVERSAQVIIAQLAKKHSQLRERHLINCLLGPKEALFLAKSLPQLTTLSLGGSPIGTSGVEACLRKLTRLTTLDLS